MFSTQSAETLKKSANIKPKRKEFVAKLSKFLVSQRFTVTVNTCTVHVVVQNVIMQKAKSE